MKITDLQGWVGEVNAAMLRTYAIDLDDAGLDEDERARHAEAYPDPRDFVEWFGRKYDLTSVAEVNFGRSLPSTPPSSPRRSGSARR